MTVTYKVKHRVHAEPTRATFASAKLLRTFERSLATAVETPPLDRR